MTRDEFLSLFSSLEHIGQNADELWEVVSRLQGIRASKMIEIGVSRGGSMKIWDNTLVPGGTIVGIDNENRITSTKQPIFWDFSTGKTTIHYIVGASDIPDVIAGVMEIIGTGEADFLWIDGEHSYEGCKADFNNYRQFVRPGGLIGIHDYSSIKEVKKFVDELPEKEIIDYGLGTALVEVK